ncbi:hypothetical protein BC833DRAFT_419199 [Globomyces pollinis-pini]|nr:hypothetical protein BC833DRAFT_419199 [Globomyces pollinis-pini]
MIENQIKCLDILKGDTEDCISQILNTTNHLIPSYTQRIAQDELLEILEYDMVYIVVDWAMKYLSQKYREKMVDWYAKAGINWHEFIFIMKIEGKLQSFTGTYLSDNSLQDSFTVVSHFYELLSNIKISYPNITKAYIQTDNAGCYHSNDTLIPIAFLSKTINIKIIAYIFSLMVYLPKHIDYSIIVPKN